MEKGDNVAKIVSLIKSQPKVNDSMKPCAKYHSNPIFKKYFVINLRSGINKFKISDLFE